MNTVCKTESDILSDATFMQGELVSLGALVLLVDFGDLPLAPVAARRVGFVVLMATRLSFVARRSGSLLRVAALPVRTVRHLLVLL